MSNIIMRYEDYLIHTKHASDNTVASYMRDLRQYASYLGSEGVDVLDADQAVVSGYMGSMKAGGKSAATKLTRIPVAYRTSSMALSRQPFISETLGCCKRSSTSFPVRICGSFFSALSILMLWIGFRSGPR